MMWGLADRPKEICPPVWVDIRTQTRCYKCQKVCKKKCVCRSCGKMYCGTDTVKMDFPDAFKKKAKPGMRRCCDQCRFLIKMDFKLVAEPSSKPNVPIRRDDMKAKDKAGESIRRFTTTLERPGTAQQHYYYTYLRIIHHYIYYFNYKPTLHYFPHYTQLQLHNSSQ